jgi:hypothetical protein
VQITAEEIRIDLEDLDSFEENIDALVDGSLDDFPENDMVHDHITEYATRIARANIKPQTRDGHTRQVVRSTL